MRRARRILGNCLGLGAVPRPGRAPLPQEARSPALSARPRDCRSAPPHASGVWGRRRRKRSGSRAEPVEREVEEAPWPWPQRSERVSRRRPHGPAAPWRPYSCATRAGEERRGEAGAGRRTRLSWGLAAPSARGGSTSAGAGGGPTPHRGVVAAAATQLRIDACPISPELISPELNRSFVCSRRSRSPAGWGFWSWVPPFFKPSSQVYCCYVGLGEPGLSRRSRVQPVTGLISESKAPGEARKASGPCQVTCSCLNNNTESPLPNASMARNGSLGNVTANHGNESCAFVVVMFKTPLPQHDQRGIVEVLNSHSSSQNKSHLLSGGCQSKQVSGTRGNVPA